MREKQDLGHSPAKNRIWVILRYTVIEAESYWYSRRAREKAITKYKVQRSAQYRLHIYIYKNMMFQKISAFNIVLSFIVLDRRVLTILYYVYYVYVYDNSLL